MTHSNTSTQAYSQLYAPVFTRNIVVSSPFGCSYDDFIAAKATVTTSSSVKSGRATVERMDAHLVGVVMSAHRYCEKQKQGTLDILDPDGTYVAIDVYHQYKAIKKDRDSEQRESGGFVALRKENARQDVKELEEELDESLAASGDEGLDELGLGLANAKTKNKKNNKKKKDNKKKQKQQLQQPGTSSLAVAASETHTVLGNDGILSELDTATFDAVQVSPPFPSYIANGVSEESTVSLASPPLGSTTLKCDRCDSMLSVLLAFEKRFDRLEDENRVIHEDNRVLHEGNRVLLAKIDCLEDKIESMQTTQEKFARKYSRESSELRGRISAISEQRDDVTKNIEQLYSIYRRNLIDNVRVLLLSLETVNPSKRYVRNHEAYKFLTSKTEEILASVDGFNVEMLTLILKGKTEGNDVAHGDQVIKRHHIEEAIQSRLLSEHEQSVYEAIFRWYYENDSKARTKV